MLINLVEIELLSLTEILEVKQSRLLLVIQILLLLVNEKFSLELLDEVGAVNVARSARFGRHSILVQPLVLPRSLQPREVADDLVLTPVKLIVAAEAIDVCDILFFFGEFFHELLVEFFSFFLLLHVQEAPGGAVLAVFAVRDDANNNPEGGEYCGGKEVLAGRHVDEHHFEADEEAEDADQGVLGKH